VEDEEIGNEIQPLGTSTKQRDVKWYQFWHWTVIMLLN
jgi:hypothetical protein